MAKTLRVIVESMEHSEDARLIRGINLDHELDGTEHDSSRCPRCRLEALLAEYEVDLVKLVLQHEVKMSGAGDGEFFVSCQCGRVFTSWSTESPDAHGKWSKHRADELETWLAVNLERIKAQARLDEAQWWIAQMHSRAMGKFFRDAPIDLSVERERIAALEAQAKEKPR